MNPIHILNVYLLDPLLSFERIGDAMRYVSCPSRAVFLNRRAAARYRALASIIPGREKLSWNLSF